MKKRQNKETKQRTVPSRSPNSTRNREGRRKAHLRTNSEGMPPQHTARAFDLQVHPRPSPLHKTRPIALQLCLFQLKILFQSRWLHAKIRRCLAPIQGRVRVRQKSAHGVELSNGAEHQLQILSEIYEREQVHNQAKRLLNRNSNSGEFLVVRSVGWGKIYTTEPTVDMTKYGVHGIAVSLALEIITLLELSEPAVQPTLAQHVRIMPAPGNGPKQIPYHAIRERKSLERQPVILVVPCETAKNGRGTRGANLESYVLPSVCV